MEVMLNLVDTLMEIGVHKNWQTDEDQDPQPETVDPLAEFQKEKESKARITSTTKRRFFSSNECHFSSFLDFRKETLVFLVLKVKIRRMLKPVKIKKNRRKKKISTAPIICLCILF